MQNKFKSLGELIERFSLFVGNIKTIFRYIIRKIIFGINVAYVFIISFYFLKTFHVWACVWP
jgi:hypothetical protein